MDCFSFVTGISSIIGLIISAVSLVNDLLNKKEK